MKKVIGVRFRETGKIYYFDPLNLEPDVGENVIVETERGQEFGTVVLRSRMIEEEKIIKSLRPIVRMAGEDDVKRVEENKQKNKKAFEICSRKIEERGLEMKLIDVEYSFDGSKVLFYFTADGRVDFRELVKDLAAIFRTRIELRQVGVRDEARIQGGIGICGRPLCCHTYLSDFAPVTIKMAKDQGLSLNPTKISGVCGRLMCCLNNEEETYIYLNSRMPNVGEIVTTIDGVTGEVSATSVLRQKVKLIVTGDDDSKEIVECSVSELKLKPGKRRPGREKGNDIPMTEEESEELRSLADESPEIPAEKESKVSRKPERKDERRKDNKEGGKAGGKDGRENVRDGRGDAARDNNRGGKDSKDGNNKDNRDNRESRKNRNNQKNAGGRGGSQGKKNDPQGAVKNDQRNNKQNRDNRDNQDVRDNKENRDGRDNRDNRGGKNNRQNYHRNHRNGGVKKESSNSSNE